MKRESMLSQIAKIKLYEDGWFDNSTGKAFDGLLLDTLVNIFSVPIFDAYIPYIYAMPDNKISIEWGLYNNIICMEVDLTTFVGNYSSYNTCTYQAYKTNIYLPTELYILYDLLKQANISCV